MYRSILPHTLPKDYFRIIRMFSTKALSAARAVSPHAHATSTTQCLRMFSTSNIVNQKVGFVGLGNMGRHMANNLIKAGHEVTVYDINTTAAASLAEKGAKVANSPGEVASQVETVITMVPNSSHVIDVYEGEGGIIDSAKPGLQCIDASTIDPAASRQVHASATKKGLTFVDAPVSGGVGGAENGTLTFMVGGDDESFAKAKEVLTDMGKNIVHCGGVGTGEVAKICNNMCMGISMAGVAESFNLGAKLGIDKKVLADIINSSTGRCWSSDTYNPVPGVMEGVPASRDYEGGFGTALMLKDLGLATQAATANQAAIPLGNAAQAVYSTMTAHGYGKKDFSSVYAHLKGDRAE
ncbi:3-hydroxyisobutyrate dehydrogenase [Sphaeroforma arctica JP610]|uniref:3-hydroxyisobutyrate dehydrogenase n=1 Tax=Sphaeroforma arctica JP610 TaxID=667725 RepID=A0A0L0FNB3_9EUKA|nr:3-hydroxyisobutyrate dehydrogenase [Sphaeroforma arctica JP610]KNC77976.1 3-hydroxyisobutyrate dehydrogenase [Sphaeroforma arctica JP610]|eukprot:XP_014151878.1 3-hydroxyisobutyrate dehydrogenase [Sphaeroforma arctica JP610]